MRQCLENVFRASLLNSHILMNMITQYSDFIKNTHVMITSTLHAKSDISLISQSCLKLSIPNIELIFSTTSPSLSASPITVISNKLGSHLEPFPLCSSPSGTEFHLSESVDPVILKSMCFHPLSLSLLWFRSS